MTDDDALARFAVRVATMQEERKERVDEALLREVALELGMSDEDLSRARAEGEARKQRARTLRQAGNLERAINELEDAAAFNPLDIEAQRLLADALHTRALKTRSADDHSRAKALALSVLEAAPADAEMASLLRAIENADPAARPSGIPLALVAFVLVAVAVVGAVLLFLA